jgi:predicted dehydrogenase
MSPDERRSDEQGQDGGRWSRRSVLKALVSLPIFGGFLAAYLDKRALERARRQAVLQELGVTETGPAVIDDFMSRPPGQRVRLGILGYGYEGEALMRHAGFASPAWVEEARRSHQENPADRDLETYLGQNDLNVVFTGVCDLYDGRAETAIAASAVDVRPGGAPAAASATRYRSYTDMLESGEVDAVIIATPDHWHTQIAVDAEAAGVHVYCEKAMTRTEEEALAMLNAFRDSDVKFQLGHQNRQSESHLKAREIVDADILGPITLVEGTTNRNTPWGAWVWEIPEDASPQNVDWAQFQQNAGGTAPFSLERFFRWRCWYDYGTGLAGDLMSHEYDAVNMVLGLGIPKSVVASGGIYHFKDGRDVPDVFQAVCEYPDRELTFVYSATLANGNYRGLQFMGHDGTMRLAGSLNVVPDNNSTRYGDKIEEGIISPERPMFTYQPGFTGIDAVTSATAEYFASRGLLYTYRGGRRVSAYHLHIAEWLDAIRNGGTPSCDIEQGFQEAITCHMATRSFLEGRKVEWDPAQQRIV